MTESRLFDPEAEEFKHLELMNRLREDHQRNMEPPKTQQQFYDELRNGVIEEVAVSIEKMRGFGKDTIDSFAIYIRKMKND